MKFSSYANETFGSGIIELLLAETTTPTPNSDNLSELKVLLNLERSKWMNLSQSSDALNYSQFYEFLFTDESAKLKELEKEISFRAYDTNSDGYLSADEFAVAIKGV